MPQEHELTPVRSVRPPRATRALRSLVLTVLLGALLAACSSGPTPTPDPDPDPPPQPPRLTAPATMHGVTTASVQVRADGAWQLRVLEAQGAAPPITSRVALSRTSGSGSASVTLTVDPTGLDHAPDYPFRLQLQAAGRTLVSDVVFTFPYVTGYALQAAADGWGLEPASAGAPVVIEPGGPSETAEGSTGAETRLAAAHAPQRPLSTEPTGTGDAGAAEIITLIVGLEAADRSLSATGMAGTPAPAALSALSATVAGIGGGAVTFRFDEAGLAFVEVPASEAAAAISELSSTNGVRYVELPVPIYPYSNDQFRHLQWNLDRVQAEQLWAVSDGAGVTIAVLDNGFYPRHPDLAGNLVGQYDAGDQKAGVEATNAECGTHGTHVAGIAAATANNGIGVAGAAPGAGLYLVDLDYETRAGCPMDTASLIRGIQHVVNGGAIRAEVMNLSLGTGTPLGTPTVNALQAARNAGIIIVGAAGNTACGSGQSTNNPVSYPAAYSQVWAVGATDPDDGRACYSHVGPELFIAAPGGDGFGPNGRYDTIFSTDFDLVGGNHVYGWQEGTSMAAPMVAGIVALLKGAVPGATDSEIRQAIIDGAVDLGASGRDTQFGYGLINAVAAYDALMGGEEPPPPPPPPPPVGAMQISFPDHPQYPAMLLDPDGLFTIVNVPIGPFRIVVATDENGDGIFGGAGEHLGEVTIDVQFDQANQVVVVLEER